jgi:hypothetical protein
VSISVVDMVIGIRRNLSNFSLAQDNNAYSKSALVG